MAEIITDMTDDDLVTILDSMVIDAVGNQDAFKKDTEEAQRRYNAEPYGTEVPGRSSVVTNDHQDLVESDMPSLARIFLGAGKIFNFVPNSEDPADIEEAKDKTAYVDWLIRAQDESFAVHHGFLKDACMLPMGVLKYFFEKTEKTEEHGFTNLSPEEIEETIDKLEEGIGLREAEILHKSKPNDMGEVDMKFRVKVTREEIKIVGMPVDSFLISKGASSKDDADLVGDKATKTRGDLVAEGNTKDMVNKLPMADTSGDTAMQIRFQDQGGLDGNDFRTWANEEVEIHDLYVRVDFDGDGVAERRHIMKSGDEILVNEAFDHVPYAIASGILDSHKAIGHSRMSVISKTAEIKTAITRRMLDNTYQVSNPKLAINKQVDLDSVLNDSISGVVRTKGEDNPANHMFPLTVPFVGNEMLLIIQAMDQNKAASVGNQLASQGLNADQLNKETATRFEGVQDASMAKIELTSRVIAEVGYRSLYQGVAWLVTRFQTTEREFTVLGKALKSNPKNWKFDHLMKSEIAGENEQLVENMTGIWNIQQVLKQQQSLLVDNDKEYNTLVKLGKGLEIKDISEHFNNPAEPDDLLRAQNEQLNAMVLQQQEQLKILNDNPLAEAAKIEAEGKLIEAQGKRELDVATMLQDAKEFKQEMRLEFDKLAEKARATDLKTATDLTKIEADSGIDVEGSNI